LAFDDWLGTQLQRFFVEHARLMANWDWTTALTVSQVVWGRQEERNLLVHGLLRICALGKKRTEVHDFLRGKFLREGSA